MSKAKKQRTVGKPKVEIKVAHRSIPAIEFTDGKFVRYDSFEKFEEVLEEYGYQN